MFMMYEIFTFGISAILSFTLSMIILLIVAAKRGLLRVGGCNMPQKHNDPLLAISPPKPKIVEMTPLNQVPPVV